MKRYKKTITLHYKHVLSIEGEEALAKVFDDIFKRLIKKRKDSLERKTKSALTIA